MKCFSPKPLFIRFVLVCALTLGLVAPVFTQTQESLSNRRPRADFSRLVVIGDSLSAGYQNNSLLDTQQVNGYANLIARRARVELPHPLIAYPGIPNVLRLIDVGPPPVIVPESGISTGRIDPTLQVRNLAVPGARVQDVLTTRPDARDGINTLTDIVLGLPAFVPNVGDGVARSQIEFAEELKPSVVLLWIGNNDALGAALAADPALLTSQADFERAYEEVARRVRATGARTVVANIPDVTVVPYLTSAAEVALLFKLPPAFINARLGIASGDYVTPAAFPLVTAILAGASTAQLPPNTVLTRAEAATIRERVAGFNRFIARQAQRNGFALADINKLLNRIDRFGYPVVLTNPFEIRLLTTTFLGGLFSLDGVHPTNTGYAIIANEFIHQLDSRFNARLLPVNVWRIASGDPLVLRGDANERVPRAPVAASAAATGDVLGALR